MYPPSGKNKTQEYGDMQCYEEINFNYGEAIRRFASDLHQNPELSFQESHTTQKLKAQLSALGIEMPASGLDTGVIGILRGGDGPVIALRADIDAIRQTEQFPRPDASAVPGVMHGCGHDVHTAGLLGAAMYLSAHRELLKGDVVFVFQPAEEVLGGAKELLAHGLWDAVQPAALFGLHNLPDLPVGTVGVKSGVVMSYKDGFMIRYIGRSGHTSTPQNNIDPTVAIASLVLSLQTVVSRNVGPLEQTVLTVCSISAGKPYTTTVDDAVITGNIRTLSAEVRQRVLQHVRRIAENTAAAYGCRIELDIHEITPGVENAEALLPIAAAAAAETVGIENVCSPSVNMASEDFSILGRSLPYFFYFLGSGVPGEAPIPWHNACFHTDPQTPVYGAALLAQSVIKAQRML